MRAGIHPVTRRVVGAPTAISPPVRAFTAATVGSSTPGVQGRSPCHAAEPHIGAADQNGGRDGHIALPRTQVRALQEPSWVGRFHRYADSGEAFPLTFAAAG